MNKTLTQKVLVFFCFFVVLAAFTTNSIGQEEKSVLDRIQRIDDPELGELIRIAIENTKVSLLKELETLTRNEEEHKKFENSIEKIELQTVRKVTEAYSEIKLLDSQIEQIEKRLSLSKSPETLTNELFLAKTELEARLTDKLAELREIMHIIPVHPLGRRKLEELNTWIKLDVIGDQVSVFNCSKPFDEYAYRMKHNFVKMMSLKEAFDYVTNNIKELPIRIDILRNTEGIKLSDELNKQIIDFIKDKKLEMEAEVHLDDHIRTLPTTGRIIIHDEKIGTSIRTQDTPRGKIETLSGIIDPNELESYIQAILIRQPSLLPNTILLQHDDESKDLALSIEKNVKDFAQEKGIDKLVTVKMQLYYLQDK